MLKIILLLLLLPFVSRGQQIRYSTDLELLRDIAGKVDYIGLGEATHGDGTTFEKKVGLIKYLHDSCGYTILVFESPLYDGEIAGKNIFSVPDPLLKSIYGVWGTEEVLELQSYILSTFTTSRPLFFSGLDCQFGGYFSRNGHVGYSFRRLQDTLSQIYAARYIKDSSKKRYAALEKLIRISGKFNTISFSDTLVLERELTKIQELTDTDTARYFRLWSQTIQCLKVNYRISSRKAFDSGLRDSMMFQNFCWLGGADASGKNDYLGRHRSYRVQSPADTR